MAKDTDAIQEFLNLAHDRFRLSAEAEADSRRDALDDLKFSLGEQWPDSIKAQRQLDGRPCLTMNRLKQFLRQLVNGLRAQRNAVNVDPIGSGADVETAEILQGIFRHIEVRCSAEDAYDYAADYMARTGFGYLRVLTDYADDDDDAQEIEIEAVENPFCVYADPHRKIADSHSGDYWFIVSDLSPAQFKERYPGSKYATAELSLRDYQSVGDSSPQWASSENPEPSIRVAEYFYREREGRKSTWKRAVISARDCLEGGPAKEIVWPSKYAPVIPMLGEALILDGKVCISGLVRAMKDPQRAYNYWNSAATEMIALAPRAPFIGFVGQFKTKSSQWEQLNIRNVAYLEADPVSINGTPAPLPQRNAVEPPIQAMREMLQIAAADMEAESGINDAVLGRSKADESGKAVLARQQQGERATANFSENVGRAVRAVGRVVLDLIPKVYTEARVQRIVNPDGTAKQVGLVNAAPEEGLSKEEQEMFRAANISKIYNVGVGKYDVTVTAGPSYQSKRQEAAASMMALVQAFPQIMPVAGDLLVRNMDWPGSKEIADRLKKMLPPQLHDANANDPASQVQALQAQLNALGQQHGLLVQALERANQVIGEKQVEARTKMSIAQMQEETKLAIAEVQTKAQNLKFRSQLEQDLWAEAHSAAHDTALDAQQSSAAQQMAAQQAAQQPQPAQTQ